jgi:branched-chain amino acid transport system substrate-binding protein
MPAVLNRVETSMLRALLKVLLCTALAFCAGASRPAKAESKDIIVGFAVALTGWMNAYDGDTSNMAKLWIDQTNAKGGLLGRKLKWIEADTKTDRTEGAKAGQEMIDRGAELLVVTCDYDWGAPAAQKGQAAGVLTVSLCAGDPKMGVPGVGRFVFSAGNASQTEGATIAEWAATKANLKKGYLLIDDSQEYSKSVCAGFAWAYKKAGGAILGSDTFKNNDANITSQVTRFAAAVKDHGVDNAVLCSWPPGGASALRQIRAAGIQVPILGATAMDGLYWLDAAPGLKDFYLAVQAVVSGDANPEVDKLTQEFAAKYGRPPATGYAYEIYAWLQLWANAVTSAKTTEGKVLVPIMETYTAAPTILGPRTYTPKWHIFTKVPMTVVEIAGGKQKVIDRLQIAGEIPDNILLRSKK